MIRNIPHATVPVRDYDEAKAFYVDVLELECRDDVPTPDGGRWLTVGASDDEFALVLQESEDAGTSHVVAVLRTDDCRATYETLRDRGVTFHGEPEERPWGIEVVFEDPDGNRLDLFESLPLE